MFAVWKREGIKMRKFVRMRSFTADGNADPNFSLKKKDSLAKNAPVLEEVREVREARRLFSV